MQKKRRKPLWPLRKKKEKATKKEKPTKKKETKKKVEKKDENKGTKTDKAE